MARGRDMDNAAIAAEAMSREDYLRDIIRDNRQQAQGLGSYASGLNRATGIDPMAMLRGGSNYTQQGYGERAALFGIPQEQVTRINPDAGVNIGLQDKLIVRTTWRTLMRLASRRHQVPQVHLCKH